MSDDLIATAVQKGLQKARDEQLQKEDHLSEVYNRASGLLNGLTALQKMEGSSFEYEVTEKEKGGILITTNISAEKLSWKGSGYIEIHVNPDGHPKAIGDRDYKGVYAFGFETKEKISAHKKEKATERVLAFVAEKAFKSGLIDLETIETAEARAVGLERDIPAQEPLKL